MSSEVPTQLEAKYDRQLRLWGLGGQALLQSAHVCLLTASACGTETLKNLVLPGIGTFTIVDGKNVDHDDLGTNFFVALPDLGKSRAECTTLRLCELNMEANGVQGVKGIAVQEDPAQLIEKNPKFFSERGITLVIATQLPEKALVALSRALEDIPLIVVRSCGEIGFVRVQCGGRAILESFPDQVPEDYRITNPFPELKEFVASVGEPDAVTDTLARSHIPYPVLLMHYFNQWRQGAGQTWVGGAITTAEKRQINALITAGRHENKDENFNEALKNTHKILDPAVPQAIRDLIESKNADTENLNAETEPFWWCVAALRKFFLKNQKMPINGKLQDMTATTEWFLGMQEAFQKKADQDRAEMAAYVQEFQAPIAAQGQTPVAVSEAFLTAFCKNVWAVRYVRTRPVYEECDATNAKSDLISSNLASEQPDLGWYLLLRASEKYFELHQQYPDAEIDGAEAELTKLLHELVQELGAKGSVNPDIVKEWLRFGSIEMHTTSAVLGGVASQEVLKLVTKQRVPLNNTYIFNGISHSMHVFEL